MPNVKTVVDKGDTAALLHLDDGSKPIWTPNRELARELLGKPIPADWTIKEGEYGKQAFAPRKGGGGGGVAWRNTREGFEAESRGRQRWQEIEENCRDVRTALMQAVAKFTHDEQLGADLYPSSLLKCADEFLEWIRKSKASASPISPGRIDADVAAVAGSEPAAPESDGGVSASLSTPSGSSTYPMKPEECDHKTGSGRWLPTRQIDGAPYCPRCGASAVLYRESG